MIVDIQTKNPQLGILSGISVDIRLSAGDRLLDFNFFFDKKGEPKYFSFKHFRMKINRVPFLLETGRKLFPAVIESAHHYDIGADRRYFRNSLIVRIVFLRQIDGGNR